MRSRTIRIIIVLSLLASAGIIVTQIFWVQRAYAISEQSFNLRVNIALRNAGLGIMRAGGVQEPHYSPVEQLSPDCFVVQTNAFVGRDMLRDYLVEEFTRLNILTDFQYGLSACHDNRTGGAAYTGYYRMANALEAPPSAQTPFPELRRENHYFSVYFPHRHRFLAGQLQVWIVSSLVLLCVICFLCYLLHVIFRQRRLSEVQRDFINNMTHEFKTPLSSIQLCAEVLKNPDILQHPQRLLSYATIISAESVNLTAQIERVLQMARAERGSGLKLATSRFVWQDILREEAALYRADAEAKGGHITLQLPEEPVPGAGDTAHLKAAVNHLLDNALKYCERLPEVVISLRGGAKHVIVSVADNGIGIDGDKQRYIFNRFYRVPKGNIHDVKGFGLGLNYVRLVTKAHSGEVSVTSQRGKGSTFTLTFPRPS